MYESLYRGIEENPPQGVLLPGAAFTNSLHPSSYNKEAVSAFFLFAAKLLILLFLVGIVGSLLVIVVTFIEDLELFLRDEASKNQIG